MVAAALRRHVYKGVLCRQSSKSCERMPTVSGVQILTVYVEDKRGSTTYYILLRLAVSTSHHHKLNPYALCAGYC